MLLTTICKNVKRVIGGLFQERLDNQHHFEMMRRQKGGALNGASPFLCPPGSLPLFTPKNIERTMCLYFIYVCMYDHKSLAIFSQL